MAVKVQSTIEPYNDSYKVVNAKNVGVGEDNKPLDEVLQNLPSSGGGGGTVPPTAIDISGLDTDGTIVETYADGTSKTTTMEFDDKGNPTKVTDGNGNVTELTGFEMGGAGGGGDIVVDSELSLESENPVQNKVVTQEFKVVNEAIGDTNRRVSALESGGVGGGVSSWNDLTDKPFGENEDGTIKQLDNKYLEPFKFEAGFYKEFLPNTTGTNELNSTFGAFMLFCITDEATYNAFLANTEPVNVIYDGVEYACKVLTMQGMVYIGNGAPLGAEGNGEPFAIYMIEEAGTYIWCIASTVDTSATEHTVGIYQSAPDKWLLKESHLPFDAIAAYIDSYIDEALGGDY